MPTPAKSTDKTEKRQYVRKAPLKKKVTVNDYQADILINALKNERRAVVADTNTPASLKMLAIRELDDMLEQLGAAWVEGTPVVDARE